MVSTSLGFYLYFSVDPSYSIFSHWISHLGVSPNYASHFFNIGFPISFLLLIFYHLSEIIELEQKGLNVLFLDLIALSSIFQLGGTFLAGIQRFTSNAITIKQKKLLNHECKYDKRINSRDFTR